MAECTSTWSEEKRQDWNREVEQREAVLLAAAVAAKLIAAAAPAIDEEG